MYKSNDLWKSVTMPNRSRELVYDGNALDGRSAFSGTIIDVDSRSLSAYGVRVDMARCLGELADH